MRSLPAGLDTVLGEKGAKLSTGQAQRIGLARAFLRDAPILILDEPTSALDSVNEKVVMSGIREWIDERPQQRIVLLATHRRSTAALADRIYQIADGHVMHADDSAFNEDARRGGLQWLSRAAAAVEALETRNREAHDSRRARQNIYATERGSLSFREAIGLLVKGWPFFAAHRRLVVHQIGDRDLFDAAVSASRHGR